MAEQNYHIGQAITKPARHHESFRSLWETKWRIPCTMGVYPFMFASIDDFNPIVQNLVDIDFFGLQHGLREPYDWNEYASFFFSTAEDLSKRAREAEENKEKAKAAEYYLRSSAVYRIARFPKVRSPKQVEAWLKGKDMFYKGQSLLQYPVTEVHIQHTHKLPDEGPVIPVNYLLPSSATTQNPVALVMIITGLDGYRTELGVWQEGFRSKGVATIVVEVPGTGDSPAAKQDPKSPDRQWSSVLDWIDQQPEVDHKKVIVWGFSTGGYYALRIAHTHHDRLLGCVNLGGGAHHMFDADWLRHVNKLEYPFDLANALAHKFGYDCEVDEFIKEAGKFSLLNDGTLENGPCTRILLVNGSEDEIFPIDDIFVALEHGMPKEARIIHGKKHMGEPESFAIILKWIYNLLNLEGDVTDQLKTVPTTTRY